MSNLHRKFRVFHLAGHDRVERRDRAFERAARAPFTHARGDRAKRPLAPAQARRISPPSRRELPQKSAFRRKRVNQRDRGVAIVCEHFARDGQRVGCTPFHKGAGVLVRFRILDGKAFAFEILVRDFLAGQCEFFEIVSNRGEIGLGARKFVHHARVRARF